MRQQQKHPKWNSVSVKSWLAINESAKFLSLPPIIYRELCKNKFSLWMCLLLHHQYLEKLTRMSALVIDHIYVTHIGYDIMCHPCQSREYLVWGVIFFNELYINWFQDNKCLFLRSACVVLFDTHQNYCMQDNESLFTKLLILARTKINVRKHCDKIIREMTDNLILKVFTKNKAQMNA